MTGPAPERPGARRDTALASVDVARLLLRTASLAGVDARQLSAAAEVPAWELSVGARMIPAALVARLWELLEQATGEPYPGLAVARRHAFGDFGLYDYLITTSATLRDGLSAAGAYLHLVTTVGRVEVAAEGGGSVTYAYRSPAPGNRGEELCLQFTVAAFCAGARAVTARRIAPVHIALPQRPPRSADAFVATLGTSSIDFGAATAMFTFRDQDLDMPLPTADPLLAGILERYAAVFPAPPPVTWYERFQQLLDEALDAASPSLSAMARQLTMSARTLQRRLADHGTTWRKELDAARRRRAANVGLIGRPDAARLARQLRYADSRSVRRALRRWSGQA